MQKNRWAGHAACLFICCPLKNWPVAKEFSATSQLNTASKYVLNNFQKHLLIEEFSAILTALMKYVLLNLTEKHLLLWLYVPSRSLSNPPVVPAPMCKLDLLKTILYAKLYFNASSIAEHPHISGSKMKQGHFLM